MQVPASFEYARASSVEDAIALLERHGPEARLLAGGHSLLPMMKLRLARPEWLIDIGELRDELDYVRFDGSSLHIGALATHRTLLESDLLAEHLPMVRDAERVIADPVVRNRGTIGGSLCQADPAEDLSAVCAAARARCVVRSASGSREVAMTDFHVGPYETACEPAEILVEVRVPVRPSSGSAYEKVERRAGDWAIADAGIALAALRSRGITATAAEQSLRGRAPSADAIAEAARLAAQQADPMDDVRGPADYKRHLAGELTARALRRAVARALGHRSGNGNGNGSGSGNGNGNGNGRDRPT